MLKIAALHFENSAVGYYRVWLPFQELNRQGLCDAFRWPDQACAFGLPVTRADRPSGSPLASVEEVAESRDLMVFQRMASLKNLSLMLAVRATYGIPVVAECDDDMFSLPPSNNAYAAYRLREPGEGLDVTPIDPKDEALFRERTDGLLVKRDGMCFWVTSTVERAREHAERFLCEADAVTTTTEVLAGVFRKYNPRVYVLPNCLDVPRWKRAAEQRKRWNDGTIHMGWFGGMQHYDDLKIIKDVVPQALERFPNLVFHTTMMMPDFWVSHAEHPRFVHHEGVPIQQWPEALAGFGLDFALAPLNSARFNRSKSNLKYLEFGALGIPCVFSLLEPYAEVQHGVTGFIAETPGEWMEAITRLVESADLRAEIGARAQADVFRRYDIAEWAKVWQRTYEEVYSRSRARCRRVQRQARRELAKRKR